MFSDRLFPCSKLNYYIGIKFPTLSLSATVNINLLIMGCKCLGLIFFLALVSCQSESDKLATILYNEFAKDSQKEYFRTTAIREAKEILQTFPETSYAKEAKLWLAVNKINVDSLLKSDSTEAELFKKISNEIDSLNMKSATLNTSKSELFLGIKIGMSSRDYNDYIDKLITKKVLFEYGRNIYAYKLMTDSLNYYYTTFEPDYHNEKLYKLILLARRPEAYPGIDPLESLYSSKYGKCIRYSEERLWFEKNIRINMSSVLMMEDITKVPAIQIIYTDVKTEKKIGKDKKDNINKIVDEAKARDSIALKKNRTVI